jgi:hypothetical protein
VNPVHVDARKIICAGMPPMLTSLDDDRNPFTAARGQDQAAQEQRSRAGGINRAKNPSSRLTSDDRPARGRAASIQSKKAGKST